MAGAIFAAGCATACDTPRRAKSRSSDRARKIAKRLHDKWGNTTEDEYDFPPKPPRMRWANVQPPRGAIRQSGKSVGLGHHGPVRPVLKGNAAGAPRMHSMMCFNSEMEDSVAERTRPA